MNNSQPGRLVIHDHSGHAFTAALSRELAARGWNLLHLYNASFVSPKGGVESRSMDPSTFEVRGIATGPFPKYSLLGRSLAELRYSRELGRQVRSFGPDVFVSCNAPLLVSICSWFACWRRNVLYVSWVQDIYHLAVDSYSDLSGTNRGAGLPQRIARSFLARAIRILEVATINRSSRVITISQVMADNLASAGVKGSIHIIENWAPVEEIDYYPAKTGALRGRLGLKNEVPVALYAGTLGAKHLGELDSLLSVAKAIDDHHGHLVVLTEGAGGELLSNRAVAAQVRNITVAPFAPYEELPAILADADVLLAVLDTDAAAYSVPSKVLTYLCAGRPIIASIAAGNAAAHTILRAGAGTVCSPGECGCLARCVVDYLSDPSRAASEGEAARRFAEESFDIGAIADRFEGVLGSC